MKDNRAFILDGKKFEKFGEMKNTADDAINRIENRITDELDNVSLKTASAQFDGTITCEDIDELCAKFLTFVMVNDKSEILDVMEEMPDWAVFVPKPQVEKDKAYVITDEKLKLEYYRDWKLHPEKYFVGRKCD